MKLLSAIINLYYVLFPVYLEDALFVILVIEWFLPLSPSLSPFLSPSSHVVDLGGGFCLKNL